MTELSREVLQNWEVRKSKQQKEDFRGWLCRQLSSRPTKIHSANPPNNIHRNRFSFLNISLLPKKVKNVDILFIVRHLPWESNLHKVENYEIFPRVLPFC